MTRGGRQMIKYLSTRADSTKREYPMVIIMGRNSHDSSKIYFQVSNDALVDSHFLTTVIQLASTEMR
jgi:hypothetical protein